MSTPTPPNPADEQVTFVQHQLPGLDAAVYRLSIQQQLLRSDDQTVLNTLPIGRDYEFAVAGPRFRLPDPAGTMSSCFPRATRRANSTRCCPRGVLPPGISLDPFTAAARLARAAPGCDVPRWLAVLTLDDDDLAANPGLSLEPVKGQVGDLFPVARAPDRGSSAGTAYRYFDGAINTEGLEPGEASTDPIQISTCRWSCSPGSRPTIADLGLTSHVRKSRPGQAALLGAAAERPDRDVRHRGRQPLAAEGEDRARLSGLPRGTATLLPPAGPTGAGTVRLAVLAHGRSRPGHRLDFTTAMAG